jgi:hypothetical protein
MSSINHIIGRHTVVFFLFATVLCMVLYILIKIRTRGLMLARALSLSPKLFCYYRHVNMAPALQYVGTSGPLATFSSGTILSYIRTYNCNSRIPLLHINYQQWLQQIRHDYNQIVHAIWHHLDSLTAVSRFFIQFKTVQRVNDTRGHITCFAYVLKSQILQTRLTGQTTCETCASEVTNRSIIRSIAE